MKSTILLFLVCCCCSTAVISQIKKDSTAIRSYADKITIGTNLNTQTNKFTLETETVNQLQLVSNSQLKLSFSVDYDILGVSFGFSPRFLPANDDDELKGESLNYDISTNLFIGRWTQEFHYSKVQSVYVKNTGDFNPFWIEGKDPYIQFPEFKSMVWGGSTAFVHNPNFSLRNVVYNTESQLKSAGSFIPSLSYDYNHISYVFNSSKRFINSYLFNLSPSYYYTLVIKKRWFAATFLSPKIGVRFSKNGWYNSDSIEKDVNLLLSLDGGLKIGYDSDTFIFGGNLNFNTDRYSQNNKADIENRSIYARVYIGYRLNAPKSLTRTTKWINKRFNL